MATRYEYEYGMGEPTMGLPPTIADYMGQRRQLEDFQYAQAMQRNNQTRALMDRQYEEELAIDNDVKRNRLGLNGLEPMLTDRYSDAYQTVDNMGKPVPTGVDMTIGGVDGSAPAPLPQVRTRPIGLSRMIKPDFEDDLAALGQRSGRTLSTEEFAKREQIKADERSRVEQLEHELALEREKNKAMAGATVTAGKIQADNYVDPTTVANDMQTSVAQVYSKRPSTLANGELKVEVAPGGGSGKDSLDGYSPEDRKTIQDNLKLFPNQDPSKVIEILRAKGFING